MVFIPGAEREGFGSNFWQFVQKYNNLIPKLLPESRSGYLALEEEYKGEGSVGESERRKVEKGDIFFNNLDEISKQALAEKYQRFVELIRLARKDNVAKEKMSEEDWRECYELTETVYQALIQAGYNHEDLWT